MTDTHTIGIDIGTNTIKLVITEENKQTGLPKIIHTVKSPSRGFRHGYIVDLEKASESFHHLLQKAEKEYKQKITKVRFSIGGVGLNSQYVRTSVENPHKHNEIQERHIEEVLQKSEDLFAAKYPNKKILHIIPVKYRVDGKDVLGSPLGMYGNLIEVKVIFITILEHHYDALISIIEKENIGILDIIAAPIADAAGNISYEQRTQGCLIVNIGAETTSLATFENSILTSLDVIQIGANDITNDIALGLQVPLEIAEDIKIGKNSEYPKRKVEEIIHARVADILELIGRHLEKIKKSRLLPAGIIFTGGGSHIDFLNDYTKQELRLPSSTIEISRISKKTKRPLSVPNEFSVAFGLCASEQGHQSFRGSKFSLKKIRQSLNYLINQIMP